VLAHDLDLHPETVRSALSRLVDYKLIAEDGRGPDGQPNWTLDLSLRRPAGSYREFERLHQGLAAAKKSRYRKKARTTDVHRVALGTSTTQDCGQEKSVSTVDNGGRPPRTTVDDRFYNTKRLQLKNFSTTKL
jgi:hypothetical protein